MTGHSRAIASLGVISLFIFGGVLTATANYTSSDKAAADLTAPDKVAAPVQPWTPKSTDWPTFHDNNARTGLTSATATMKLAYYKWAAKTGGPVLSSPAVATVNTAINGTTNTDMKVFIGGMDSRFYCFDGRTGGVLWRYQTSSSVISSPAVGDLSGDGNSMVVFGSGDNRVYCLYCQNGTLAWRYTTRSSVDASPALADLNGDGKLEVIIGSTDGILYVLDCAGKLLYKNTLIQGGIGIGAAAAVGDVNGDNKPEIIVQYGHSNISCIGGADGRILWDHGWNGSYNPHADCSPVVADLDGDGAVEVIMLGGWEDAYCLYGGNGTIKWHQDYPGTVSQFESTPAVGDGNGDGKMEIFMNGVTTVICVDPDDGQVDWAHDFREGAKVVSTITTSPALGDIDGDGRLEVVLAGWDRQMHALNAEDGTVRWSYPCPMGLGSSPAIADIDGDGKAEVVFGCMDQRVYALDYNF